MLKNKELIIVNSILFIILFAFGAAVLTSGQTMPVFNPVNDPIYGVDTDQKQISIMCNVYWGTEYIEPYLKLFEEHNIKITFFIGGSWAADNPDLVQRMQQAGHEIANHGYSHKLASKNSVNVMNDELVKADRLLTEICGVKPTLYAPPSGDFTKESLDIAKKNGYNTIMWTIDTIDWRDKDCEKVKKRIVNNVKPGAFILLHPTKQTLDALQEVIPKLINEGYRFDTVSSLIKLAQKVQ